MVRNNRIHYRRRRRNTKTPRLVAKNVLSDFLFTRIAHTTFRVPSYDRTQFVVPSPAFRRRRYHSDPPLSRHPSTRSTVVDGVYLRYSRERELLETQTIAFAGDVSRLAFVYPGRRQRGHRHTVAQEHYQIVGRAGAQLHAGLLLHRPFGVVDPVSGLCRDKRLRTLTFGATSRRAVGPIVVT